MGGVAYTTGVELDDDHKEIHFSVEYISKIPQPRLADEILGVLTHEVVHCYQYNAHGTCPGGLIEGIADWVRLNSNLSPPHWKREASGEWDAGYHHTAYFLEYLEQRYGGGTISRMNEKLRTDRYKEKQFWTELLGRPIGQLWEDYAEDLKKENGILTRSTSGPQTTAEDEEIIMVEKEDARGSEKRAVKGDPATLTKASG
jgi:Peptidase of plants and bacteria